MRRNRTVQTAGKTHSGGVSGGLRMVLNAFIPFLVRRAERPPTARGRRRQTDKTFHLRFFITITPA